MASSLSYSSALHYILLQPEDSNFKCDEFFSHFMNEDIAKLDIAICELDLRKAFNKKVGIFYNSNSILCRSELARIVDREISLIKCKLDFRLSGKPLVCYDLRIYLLIYTFII